MVRAETDRAFDAGHDDLIKHYKAYDDYILRKVGKLVGTSNWSFSTYFEINGKPVNIGSPQSEEYMGDKSDFPQFTETRPSLGYGLKKAFFDLAGLILWNIVLSVFAFAAFLRADVRLPS